MIKKILQKAFIFRDVFDIFLNENHRIVRVESRESNFSVGVQPNNIDFY